MRADVDSSFLSLGEGFPGTLFGKGNMEAGNRRNHRADVPRMQATQRYAPKNVTGYRSGSTSPPPDARSLPFEDDERDCTSPELPKFDYNNDRIHNDLLQEICSDIGIKDAMDLDFFDFDENDLAFDDKKLDENENTDCLDQVIPFGQLQERQGGAIGYEKESKPSSQNRGYIASTGAEITVDFGLLSGQSSRCQSPTKKSPVDFDSLFPGSDDAIPTTQAAAPSSMARLDLNLRSPVRAHSAERCGAQDRLASPARSATSGEVAAHMARRPSVTEKDDNTTERPSSVPHYMDSPAHTHHPQLPRPNLASKSMPSLDSGICGAPQYSSPAKPRGAELPPPSPGHFPPPSPSHTHIPPHSPSYNFPPPSPSHGFPPPSPVRLPPASPSHGPTAGLLRTPQKAHGKDIARSSSCSQAEGPPGGKYVMSAGKQIPPPSPGGSRHHSNAAVHQLGSHSMAKQAHYNAAHMGHMPTIDGVTPLPDSSLSRGLNSPFDPGYHSVGSSTYTGSHYGSGSELGNRDTPPLSLETQSVNDKVTQYLDRSMPSCQGNQGPGYRQLPGNHMVSQGKGAHGTMAYPADHKPVIHASGSVRMPGAMPPQSAMPPNQNYGSTPGSMCSGPQIHNTQSHMMRPPSQPGAYTAGDPYRNMTAMPQDLRNSQGHLAPNMPPEQPPLQDPTQSQTNEPYNSGNSAGMPSCYNARSGSMPSSPKKQRMDMFDGSAGGQYPGGVQPPQMSSVAPQQMPSNLPPQGLSGPFDMQQLHEMPGANQVIRNPTTQPMKRRYDYKDPVVEQSGGPRLPRSRVARPNIPAHGLPIDPSQLPVFEGQREFVQKLIMDRSYAFRSHPLFPLLRDLIIADLNFHTPEFPVALIANLPSDFDRLLQNYLQRNPRRLGQDINPAIENVIMDALRYAHRTLIEKITERRRSMGDDPNARTNSAIDEFCERFDQAVKNSLVKPSGVSMQNRMRHANMAASNPLPMPGLPQQHARPQQQQVLFQQNKDLISFAANSGGRPQGTYGHMTSQSSCAMSTPQPVSSRGGGVPYNPNMVQSAAGNMYGQRPAVPNCIPPEQRTVVPNCIPPEQRSVVPNCIPPAQRSVVPNCIPPEQRTPYPRPNTGKQMPMGQSPCNYSQQRQTIQNVNIARNHQVGEFRNHGNPSMISQHRGSQECLPNIDSKHFMTKEEVQSAWSGAGSNEGHVDPVAAGIKKERREESNSNIKTVSSAEQDLICLSDDKDVPKTESIVKQEIQSLESPRPPRVNSTSSVSSHRSTPSPMTLHMVPHPPIPSKNSYMAASQGSIVSQANSSTISSQVTPLQRPELTVLTQQAQSPVPQPLSSSGSDGSSEGRPERPNSNDSGHGKENQSRKHQILPKEAVAIMLEWLRGHEDNPYPKDDEKEWLMARTQLTINQVNYWFTNARRRILPKWRLQRILEEQAKVQGQDPGKVKVTGSAQEIRAITNELLQGRTVDAFLAQAQGGQGHPGHPGGMDPAHMPQHMDPMMQNTMDNGALASYANAQGYIPIRSSQQPYPTAHPGQPPDLHLQRQQSLMHNQMNPSQAGPVNNDTLGMFM